MHAEAHRCRAASLPERFGDLGQSRESLTEAAETARDMEAEQSFLPKGPQGLTGPVRLLIDGPGQRHGDAACDAVRDCDEA